MENVKSEKEKYENIVDNLYEGGGLGQAINFMDTLMSPYASGDFGFPIFEPKHALDIISRQITQLKRNVSNGGIVHISTFKTLLKSQNYRKSKAFACLDKDLKFCVRHNEDKDSFKDILYVFLYLDPVTAYDIVREDPYPYQKDI